jgi:hypothetical protein
MYLIVELLLYLAVLNITTLLEISSSNEATMWLASMDATWLACSLGFLQWLKHGQLANPSLALEL